MIETSRLLIRHFEEQDFVDLYEFLSNPAIYRFEPGEPVNLEKAGELAYKRSQNNDFWAVILRSANKLVGQLYFVQTDPKELMTWELGYIINPVFHNQGYASEASEALIRYGFEHFNIHRVMAHCNPENAASWRVLEKIGMKKEGFFRKNIFFRTDSNGLPIWTDTFEYAILKEDFGNR
jgi:[ribosomal protein S5]-alanine N-acetyltransferase